MLDARKLSVVLAFVLVFAFGAVAFAQTATPEMATNSVTAEDQAVENNSVMIAEVVAAEAGAVVIHLDNNGAPGAAIGFTAVDAGTNTDVEVAIDVNAATNTLWAMLHSGDVSMATSPGQVEANNPAVRNADGTPVMDSFTVTGLGGAAQTTATATAAATAAATTAAAQTTPAATVEAATPAATVEAGATATRTALPATLPTTGGSDSNMLVVLLLGLGGLSLLAGLGLNLTRRTR